MHSHRHRITGRRLAAAALAVASVTGGLAAPAFAAPATGVLAAEAATGTQQQALAKLPLDASVVGNGPTGFLWIYQDTFGWTRYADGSVTKLPRGDGAEPAFYHGGAGSDVVVMTDRAKPNVFTLYDMGAKDTAPVVIDASHLGSGYHYSGLLGSTVVMTAPNWDGTADIRLFSNEDGRTVDRAVRGIPAAARWVKVDISTPDTLILRYAPNGDESAWRAALVDVASATVVEDRPLTASSRYSFQTDTAVSATHVAWTEDPSAGNAVLRVGLRGQEESKRIPLGRGTALTTEFLGDWVLYGLTDGRDADAPHPLNALTARSLKDDRTVKLLDFVREIRFDGEGALLVEGGTVGQGEGLYRITAAPGGDPVVTLMASTGRSVVLNLTGQTVPASVDFGKSPLPTLSWKFDPAVNIRVKVVLTHKASGQTTTLLNKYPNAEGLVELPWYDRFDNHSTVQRGAYTWRMTAQTGYGLGPTYERSGSLTVGGPHLPHNFTDRVRPDLLVKSPTGYLSAYETNDVLAYNGPDAEVPMAESKWATTGWGVYNHLVTPGNIGGAPQADVLGRDRNGVLWQHLGTGDRKKPFAPRTRVGTGWQAYRLITGGSDLTGDGRPDLVGIDKAGVQWLHKGTGSWSKPFADRVKMSAGWGIYNLVTATGNLAGGPAGDLVARDKDGVLWLHLGRGDGTFAPRTRISDGWNQFTEITAVGDLGNDGRPDLIARNPAHTTYKLRVYNGTGLWATPLKELGPYYWNTMFMDESDAQY
ncbi:MULTISPECIES: VCBS repeat-containing protein [unclassified Streptomyces]|uniref:FG-GAP repeat domain-containing protein n=1 Tax=unclassified Streptomyces TaxID=2593676 RepID=UPI0006F2A1B1|nr:MULTISPECIES: VCBS repeat-containing protein [unclassified Streptomyces]KQX45522.1 hypothetical protein ASD33_24050 [Streptomyces sp. Root1304]KRA79466.1 hypothetical protein ASE09_19570 [Streptomyces sp. Root66D1]